MRLRETTAAQCCARGNCTRPRPRAHHESMSSCAWGSHVAGPHDLPIVRCPSALGRRTTQQSRGHFSLLRSDLDRPLFVRSGAAGVQGSPERVDLKAQTSAPTRGVAVQTSPCKPRTPVESWPDSPVLRREPAHLLVRKPTPPAVIEWLEKPFRNCIPGRVSSFPNSAPVLSCPTMTFVTRLEVTGEKAVRRRNVAG